MKAFLESDIMDNLAWDDEILLGDKGYQGHGRILTPFKGNISPEEEAINFVIASARQIVECVIGRLKNWYCLKTPFRHRRDFHFIVFNVIAQITNMVMEIEPVWKRRNLYL